LFLFVDVTFIVNCLYLYNLQNVSVYCFMSYVYCTSVGFAVTVFKCLDVCLRWSYQIALLKAVTNA